MEKQTKVCDRCGMYKEDCICPYFESTEGFEDLGDYYLLDKVVDEVTDDAIRRKEFLDEEGYYDY